MPIDDLTIDLLREILCRLPCYRTALRCKAVSKQWCSIISDPLFVTQGFQTHSEIDKKEPYFAFLSTMKLWDEYSLTAMVAPQRPLWSSILSLQFLPCYSTPVAAFKDLILTFGINPSTYLRVFYICNPLTKQWMVLPPFQSQQKPVWATLVFMRGRGFRVVAALSEPTRCYFLMQPFRIINLIIYISETSQWQNIDVRLNYLQPSTDYYTGACFGGVVCKSMVCIHDGCYLGAFNPFDVTDTSQGTLKAIDLPPPPALDGDLRVVQLFESDGKLVALRQPYIAFSSDSKGTVTTNLSQGNPIWKLEMRLDNDKQLPQWNLISDLHGHHINVKGSIFSPCDVYDSSKGLLLQDYYCFDVVGVHPGKEHLVYLLPRDGQKSQNRLILYDTKSKSVEPLTTTVLPYDKLMNTFQKLEIPCWPTC